MTLPENQTILSGMQPSGALHLGNYLGALKQWIELQKSNSVFYCIVDLHAITVPYEVSDLPNKILDAAAMYLAAGIDPAKSTIFVQSHVPAHSELMWLLATQTPFGELERMTQFKDKSAKQDKKTSLGLFAYPVLMAADILLYQANLVPVGNDQTQHVELTRDIAKRFNNKFGDVFTVPEVFLSKSSARIMSLQDPATKMSKSDAPKSYVALNDEPDAIKKKIMSAVTDTEPNFSFAQAGPAVKNLLNIYQAISEQTQETIENKFSSSNYKDFKTALADELIAKLEPLQNKYKAIRQDEAQLKSILEDGANKAQDVANNTLRKVKQSMGFT